MAGSRPEVGSRPRKVVIRFLDALLRDTLASWVESQPGYVVAGAVSTGPALARLCALRSPDVVVMQLGAADPDELAVLAGLSTVRPEPHVVGLHNALDPTTLLRLHRAGVHRLVSSRAGVAALHAALGEAGTGRPAPLANGGGLSERELEILSLISAGCSAADIAEVLDISPHTVTNHTRRIFAKLDVHSRTQAAAEVGRLGLQWGVVSRRHPEGVGGRSGPLRDEVSRIVATGDGPAPDPVTVLVNPTESSWRTVEGRGNTVVVVGSENGGRTMVTDAVLRGARAVLNTEDLPDRLPAVISLVRAGYLVASHDAVRALLRGAPAPSPPRGLTPRERDILSSIALGHSVRQTAQALGIAIKTVQSEQRQLFSKLGVRNRPGALAHARELGLIDT